MATDPWSGVLLAAPWTRLLEGDLRLTFLLVAGLVGGVVLFFRGFRTWRRLRLIQDTPTSKVRSLALGRVELRGRAAEKAELAAPITGSPCVWYRWKLEEYVGGRNNRWQTLGEGDSAAWAFLEDDTGRILVEPDGADVHTARDYRETNPTIAGPVATFLGEQGVSPETFLGFRRTLRLSEWHIGPGDTLYVLGTAQERGTLAHERRVRIAEKLAALKSDPEAMAHFDTDGDGHVSAEEWDVARRLTVQEVDRQDVEDRVVVARSEGRTPFLISDRPESEVVKRHRLGAIGGIWGGALLSLGCLGGLLVRAGLLAIGG